MSLQSVSWDLPAVVLPSLPGIDARVYVLKCSQPMLDTGSKRPAGQAVAFRELTVW